ncbi:MAG: hypothetical protein JWM11_1943 [Planctomycetaceae bacterium]|nr:hypothetical protein [Planctomycetaceae bacterium]
MQTRDSSRLRMWVAIIPYSTCHHARYCQNVAYGLKYYELLDYGGQGSLKNQTSSHWELLLMACKRSGVKLPCLSLSESLRPQWFKFFISSPAERYVQIKGNFGTEYDPFRIIPNHDHIGNRGCVPPESVKSLRNGRVV